MASQNVPGGDSNYGTELPRTELDDTAFVELQNTAKFSRTAEFKTLKEYLLKKIDFYKTYLPDGRPIGGLDMSDHDLAVMWRSANVIIGELEQIIGAYEGAAQAVKDESQKRQNP